MKDMNTLCDLFDRIKTYNVKNLVQYHSQGTWYPISSQEFTSKVTSLACGLASLKISPNEKIGIISNPSPFWVIADLAIIHAGGITVPIFRRISPENLKFEIDDSEMNIIFIGDEKEYDSVIKYGSRIRTIITIGFSRNDSNLITFDALIETGKNLYENGHVLYTAQHRPDGNDIFTIIYTSGSTGVPKGVMLTHRNILSQIQSAALVYDLDGSTDTAISSLPLSHIFERMVLYFYLSKAVPVFFVDDLNNIGSLIRDVRPSIMTVVPRLLEKILAKMKSSIEEYRGIKKVFARSAFSFAENPLGSSLFSSFRFRIFDRLIYSKLRKALGGNFRYVISGAAALSIEVGRFFHNIGLPLYEGYGMTEASPVIACNRKGNNKPGTVGQPFPGVTIKLNDDGEILAKGPNVMAGYHNNEIETAKSLDADGFLHTGDLGTIDDEGYLKIVGRKKELFKKSTGEYVPPVPIEQALEKLDIIDIAVVIADARKFVTCVLFPDHDAVEKLRVKEGFENMDTTHFLESEFIRQRIASHIHTVNSHLHHTEEIQKFVLIPDPISIETGELTPTMKIRRSMIETRFRKEIDAMYKD